MRRFFASLPRRLFLLVMLAGFALIAATSLVYFDFGTLPPFAVEKLPVRFESLWLTSLRLHVASALVTFPLCLVLTTRTLQRRPAVHRWLGRITGVLVLLALVPSGVVLSFDAKGGGWVTAGFLLSAAIVAVSMVHGTLAARRRDLVSHRRSMRHVVAQMSVAVTSRALLMALDQYGMDPDVAYVVALWVPVLGSVAGAELISLRWPTSGRLASLAERIRRVASSFSPLRARAVVSVVARVGR